ncbi:MAG: molecular chaperone DnaJ [Actinomycetota bacterium]
MAAVRDLYELLGVGRDASPDDIKRAYRRLARELHPDVNATPEAEERFKEVSGAYEILSDPQRRQRYDAYGSEGGPGFRFGDVQDIFDMFFGTGGGSGGRRTQQRTRTQRGEDLFAVVQLTFSEAAFGAHRDLEVERAVVCGTCEGSGAEPGTAPTTCQVCGGSGQVQQVRRSIFGELVSAGPCGTCEGTGRQIASPCPTCEGHGRVLATETAPIDVPAGVADGLELRVGSGGHAGRAGGPPGDLYLSLRVEPSPLFERRGQDLVTLLEIDMTQAALGAEVEVDTLDGRERVKIEPGTEAGTVVRLKGQGIPNLHRRGRGDLFLSVRIRIPDGKDTAERELLRRRAYLRGSRAGKGSVVDGRLRHPSEP